jgi:hypothetical protein
MLADRDCLNTQKQGLPGSEKETQGINPCIICGQLQAVFSHSSNNQSLKCSKLPEFSLSLC